MPLTTLQVAELRKLSRLSAETMRRQLGPMALVERPDKQMLEREAMGGAARATVARKPKVARNALSMMMRFDDMLVIPLGVGAAEGSITLGRGATCDVKTQHPSTSSLHARVRWDASGPSAWIQDLGSTNGTFVNGARVTAETELAESDVISLGEAAFLFVTFETLQALLKAEP